MGKLAEAGAKAIVKTKMQQEARKGIVVSDADLLEYWQYVLTDSSRAEYRDQAQACLVAQVATLARLAEASS